MQLCVGVWQIHPADKQSPVLNVKYVQGYLIVVNLYVYMIIELVEGIPSIVLKQQMARIIL